MKKALLIVLAVIVFFSALFLLFYFKENIESFKGGVIEASEVEGSPYTVHVPEYYFENRDEGKVFLSSVDPWKGSLDAENVIIIFASMGPESVELFSIINKLEQDREGELAFFWKDYPVNDSAKFKAEEAHCAGEQDKFWEYADKEILGLEKELNLDTILFEECLESDEMLSLVNSNYYYTKSLKIEEGPVVYVNDELVEGELNYEKINNKINYVVQEN